MKKVLFLKTRTKQSLQKIKCDMWKCVNVYQVSTNSENRITLASVSSYAIYYFDKHLKFKSFPILI